jgi:hypothetical protein
MDGQGESINHQPCTETEKEKFPRTVVPFLCDYLLEYDVLTALQRLALQAHMTAPVTSFVPKLGSSQKLPRTRPQLGCKTHERRAW